MHRYIVELSPRNLGALTAPRTYMQPQATAGTHRTGPRHKDGDSHGMNPSFHFRPLLILILIPYSQHSTRCRIISEDFQADLFVEVGKTAVLMEITSLGGRVFVRAEA